MGIRPILIMVGRMVDLIRFLGFHEQVLRPTIKLELSELLREQATTSRAIFRTSHIAQLGLHKTKVKQPGVEFEQGIP